VVLWGIVSKALNRVERRGLFTLNETASVGCFGTVVHH
jgi:hypothetical protein